MSTRASPTSPVRSPHSSETWVTVQVRNKGHVDGQVMCRGQVDGQVTCSEVRWIKKSRAAVTCGLKGQVRGAYSEAGEEVGARLGL
eukprot:1671714-Rhodomonas_salina.1